MRHGSILAQVKQVAALTSDTHCASGRHSDSVSGTTGGDGASRRPLTASLPRVLQGREQLARLGLHLLAFSH